MIESILVIIVALLAFKMKWAVVSWGLMLAGLVLLYLLTSQYLFSLKEIFGSLFYCWGVFLPTISQLTSYESFFTQTEVVVFTMLVLSNLLIFSIYEMETDSTDNHKSFALTFGRQNTGLVVKVLLGIVSGLLIGSYWALVPIHFFILTLMTAGLILITLFPDYFKIQDRYRYVGDFIFLFPGLVVLS